MNHPKFRGNGETREQTDEGEVQFVVNTEMTRNISAFGAVSLSLLEGQELTTAYISKVSRTRETNLAVIEQKLTVIHVAINYFMPYLYDIKFLVGKYKARIYLYTLKNSSSKLKRILLDLETYDFEQL